MKPKISIIVNWIHSIYHIDLVYINVVNVNTGDKLDIHVSNKNNSHQ